MFSLADYLPYLINRAGARLAVAFGRELRRFGVALAEWRVLAALLTHGGQRLSDLAGLTSVDVSTLSRLVGRMARKGLVVRARPRTNGADQREIRIMLSAKGRRTAHAIVPTARRYERLALTGIGAREERLLKRLLVRVFANLDALDER